MQYTHILGIDVSKATIDLALSKNTAHASITHKKFSNNIKGFHSLLACFNQEKVTIGQVLICLENIRSIGRMTALYLLV